MNSCSRFVVIGLLFFCTACSNNGPIPVKSSGKKATNSSNVVTNSSNTGKTTIVVGGKKYVTDGGSISVQNGQVFIDGKPVEPGAVEEHTQGSGKPATETRELPDFSAVDLSGSISVNIKPGKTIRCTITADDNLLSFVQTKVEKKQLFISTSGNFITTSPIKVDLEMPNLTSLDSRASGQAYLENVTKDRVSISVSSSGAVTAVGTVGELVAEVRSSGSLDARYLAAEKADVNARSSGSAMIHAQQLKAEARSSGTILHDVAESKVESSVRSSGSVVRKQWPAKPKID